MKQNGKGKTGKDPYYGWKILNMFLAGIILILAVLIFVGDSDAVFVPLVFFLGVLMCSVSGIMELSRGRRIAGYAASVFAGIMMVALIFSVMRIW